MVQYIPSFSFCMKYGPQRKICKSFGCPLPYFVCRSNQFVLMFTFIFIFVSYVLQLCTYVWLKESQEFLLAIDWRHFPASSLSHSQKGIPGQGDLHLSGLIEINFSV